MINHTEYFKDLFEDKKKGLKFRRIFHNIKNRRKKARDHNVIRKSKSMSIKNIFNNID
jgi:hypothetical protein